MTAIAFGLGWLGYSVSLWGYCLVRGYDVTLAELMNPVHVFAWPAGGISGMPLVPGTQILPGGGKAGGGGGGQPGLA